MEDPLLAASKKLQAILEENSTDIAAVGYLAFNNYPNGCCEASTHFLAHYLVSRGLCKTDEIRMPWNNYDSEGLWDCFSHGWIMLRGGLNIDISANQFPGIEDKVIVSRDHEVHRRFVGGEVVSFEEHHRRLTCHDNGASFNRAWRIIEETEQVGSSNGG